METVEPYIIKTRPGEIVDVTGLNLKNIKFLYCSNNGALVVKPKRRIILRRIAKPKARTKRTRRNREQIPPETKSI